MIPGAPTGDERAPADLLDALGARAAVCVWHNEAGVLTFRLDGDRFLKWSPPGCRERHGDEVDRLRWAAGRTPVPEVLDAADDGTWLLTRAMPGTSAVDARWLADPERAVRAIGVGLRTLHDTLPVDDCPFDWSVASRLRDRLAPAAEAPSIDRLVVCHGDACAPNTLLADDGSRLGHVDLGALGTADRWADLAAASLSLGWNYGPGWEPHLLAGYGVEPDHDRLAFYRDLWLTT